MLWKHLLLYLFFGFLVGGCDGASQKWPPGSVALSTYFSEHRLVFESLDDKFVAGKWARLCSGFGASDLVVEKPHEHARQLSSSKASAIRKLLDESGMYCIHKGQGQLVQFQPHYSNSVSGYYFRIYLTHFGNTKDIDECDIVDEAREKGFCVVTLDPDWRIDYEWWVE